MAKQTKPDWQADYEREWQHWHSLHEHGGQDPFWADGSNLNLTRNHMIYDIREGAVPPPDKPLPPEVRNDYMASTDVIRKAAKALLADMMATDSFDRLALIVDDLPEELRSGARNIVRYRGNLEEAIRKDELVDMRRMANIGKHILKSPEEYLSKMPVNAMAGQQISIFSLMGG